jgi:hypothetical protein
LRRRAAQQRTGKSERQQRNLQAVLQHRKSLTAPLYAPRQYPHTGARALRNARLQVSPRRIVRDGRPQ